MLIRVLLILLVAAPAFAQSKDFFSNIQGTNLRASSSVANPGFEPCVGATTNGGATCDGTGLLSQTKVTGGSVAAKFAPTPSECNTALTITPGNVGSPLCDGGTGGGSGKGALAAFPKLGPGAVTDNMLGIISGTDSGADPAVTTDDRNTTRCGLTGNSAGVLPTGLGGLNCGNLRFDPTSQAQSIPTFGQDTTSRGTNNQLTSLMTADTPQKADFCNGVEASSCDPDGSGPGAALAQDGRHTGIDFSTLFTWNPTTAAGCVTPICISLDQKVKQVTQTKSGTPGTLAAPAAIDQVFTANATFSIVGAFNKLGFTCNQAPGADTCTAKVNWTQTISDPDQTGSGSAFVQNLTGSFNYNALAAPFDCPAAGNQGCAQYPDGISQTNRSRAAQDTTIKETLP